MGWIFHNTCPSLFSLDDDVSCSLVRVLSQLVLLSSHRWILSLPLNGTSTSKDFKRERGKKDFEDWEKRRDRDDWGGLWRNAEAIVRQWADSCVLTTHQLCPHTAVVSSHGWPKAPLYHRMQHRTCQWPHRAEKAPPMGKTLFSLLISFLPFTSNPLLPFNNIQQHTAYDI